MIVRMIQSKISNVVEKPEVEQKLLHVANDAKNFNFVNGRKKWVF